MSSRLENRLTLYLALILSAAILAIVVFVFASPVLFMMGIAGLIYETLPLGYNLGFGIPGLLITVIGLWWIITDDLENRQKGKNSGMNKLIIGLSVLGIIEIIFGILQSFDDVKFFRFMFVGGGCITFLPVFVYLVVIMYQQKSEKLMKLPSKSNLSKPVTRSLLKDVSAKRKMHDLWELGNKGDQQAIPTVLDALKDEDIYVRRRAAEVLGKIGNKQAVEPMRKILFEEQEYGTRKKIEEAMRKLENDYNEVTSTKTYSPICTSCGAENTNDQPFCSSCGGLLKE